jgi:hypothetical protein
VTRYLMALGLIVLSLHSNGAASLGQLETLFRTPEQLQGHFEQIKYIGSLDAEFSSTGTFEYRRGESIQWNTLEPIENLLVLTPDSISNRQGGNELMRLDGSSSPVVAVFSNIFFGVMSAEWERLSGYFDMEVQSVDQGWRVMLHPLDTSVGQIVSRVELRGDALLREVRLYEAAGDHTLIRFVDLQP